MPKTQNQIFPHLDPFSQSWSHISNSFLSKTDINVTTSIHDVFVCFHNKKILTQQMSIAQITIR